MSWLADPEAWIALLTLTSLEIVLGIDNIVFISILTGRLPEEQRSSARKIGLALALITRIALLFSLTWIMRLTTPWFALFGHEVSGRDLILIVGGLFLIAKSTVEIHHKIEDADKPGVRVGTASYGSVLVQVMLLDVVFSLDSIITAVGMVKSEFIGVMVTAVVLAMIVMILFVDTVSRFVERHPTFKMLALSFLVLIGVSLLAEGFHLQIPKGYIYFAMAFSALVEVLNTRIRGGRAQSNAG